IVERYAIQKPGLYCDVGCGPGGVLKIAQERGWNAVGVEISSWAVQEGKKNGLNIFEGSLLDAAFPSNHFDAVSMFDVLEHLTTPKEYLSEIQRILKPGGVLVVETPNVDGFFARYVYKENADLIKPRAHICLYGPASAKYLVSSIGFSDFKIMTFPYSRKLSPGYVKSVITSRLMTGRTPVQLTLNDSLRVVCWK
ncbi:MAG: class I SAM-dependent methyltransferase, partial [bacterium]